MSIDDAGDSRLLPTGVAKPLRSPAPGAAGLPGDAPADAPLLSAMSTTRLHDVRNTGDATWFQGSSRAVGNDQLWAGYPAPAGMLQHSYQTGSLGNHLLPLLGEAAAAVGGCSTTGWPPRLPSKPPKLARKPPFG